MKRRSNAGFTLAETLMTVLIVMLASLIMANIVPEALRLYDRVVTASNARLLMSTTISVLRDEMATARDVTVSADGTDITYISMDRGAQCQIILSDGVPAEDEGDTAPGEGDTTPGEGGTPPDEGDTAPGEGDTTPGNTLKEIYIREYIDRDPVTGEYLFAREVSGKKVPLAPPRLLVSHETGERNGLRVTFDRIALENGIITFEGLAVYRVSDTDKPSPVPVGMTTGTDNTIALSVRMIMPPQTTTPPDGGEVIVETDIGG